MGRYRKQFGALVLLVPLYWWMVCVLPPVGAVEFVTHMAEAGEHCVSFCQHPSSPVDQPPQSAVLDTLVDQQAFHAPVGLRPYRRVRQNRPPPLFYSLSRSLRAPPSLIER
ncbi:MAG: hypothetical protein JNL86_17995 [Nitrospira sp.]|nr:hypothetical protein [Nitrospira sp.]MCC7472111.1 hypothetical protein [Candidatus Nomurabacteria bacterium]